MQPSGAAKRRLRRWLVDGALRPAAAPVYRGIVAGELGWERLCDVGTSYDGRGEGLRDLTALIKTFERPRVLRRLIASIRRLYPRLELLVVDDSETPRPVELDGVKTLTLPHDSGLSAGRRAGLAHIATPFFLLLDDDFVFFRRTDLLPALELMKRHSEIDILGGEVVDLPFYARHDYRAGGLYPTRTSREPLRAPGTLVGGLPVYEKVANFFIGRTARVRVVDWDPELRIMEHTDFFTRARGRLLTVFDERLKVLHARTLFDRRYLDRRQDYDAALRILRDRYPI